MMKAFPVFTEIPLAPEVRQVRHLPLEERVRLLEKQGLDHEIRILTLEEELKEALLTVGTVGKKVDLLSERVQKLENSQSEILVNLGECVRKTNEVHEELDSTFDQISECQSELNLYRNDIDSIFEQVRTIDMLTQHMYEESLKHVQADRQMTRMNELENAIKRLRGHTDQEIQSLAEKVKENRAEFDHLELYLEVGRQDNVMDRLYVTEQQIDNIRSDESYLSAKLNDLEKVVECIREIMKNAHQMFGNDLRELQNYCEDSIRRITDHLELDPRGISRLERCEQNIDLLEFQVSNLETDEEQARRENLLEKERNDYIDYCCIHDLEPDMEMFDSQIESERTTLSIAPSLSEHIYETNFPSL